MAQTQTTPTAIKLPAGVDKAKLLTKLQHEKKVAINYQKRRHPVWNEIYELYRNIVKTNRLTQRQAINIPLMKETIRTIGSKINEETDVKLEDKGGELDKEIMINAIWEYAVECDSFTLLDRVDKKQEQLYGRSHFVLNVNPDRDIPVTIGVKDVYELLVDPKTSPWDIDTARYTIETNIYKPLDEILTSAKYDGAAKAELKKSYEKKEGRGTVNGDRYQRQLADKNERLKSLGIENVESIEGYDKIVSLDGHITYIWDKALKKNVRYYVTVANEEIILRADTLQNVLGVDFLPYEGWADDLEITDYWSDGTGDLILTPNKTINSWISQYMENRTLRSFGMNYYDSTIEGFTPTTFQPRPWGWYPVAGKPDDVFKNVQVPDLSGTLDDIQFIVNIAEKASATGALDKGAVEDVKRTLGEIQIAVSNALRRTNDLAPLYLRARQRLVEKWYKLLEANVPEGKTLKLYKKGADGKIIGKEITRKEWVSDEGYKVTVGTNGQYLLDAVDQIQRMKAVQAEFPNNMALKKAIQKRMVRLIDLTPQEAAEIEAEEADNIQKQLAGAYAGASGAVPNEQQGYAVAGKPSGFIPAGGDQGGGFNAAAFTAGAGQGQGAGQ